MKRVAIVVSITAVSVIMLGGTCDITGCKAKWIQGNDKDIWELNGTTSQYILMPDGSSYKSENADDFECRDGEPINYVTWFGVHCLGKETTGPVYLYHDFGNPTYYEYCGCPFIIRFYDDNGEEPPNSLPIGDPLAEYEVIPEDLKSTVGVKTVYMYVAELDPPFEQEKGKTYWISIILNCGENKLGEPPEYHPQWFWQFSNEQWNDYPAQNSEYWYTDTSWHSLYHEKEVRDDMAFWLTVKEP